jgi:hypothetical protein
MPLPKDATISARIKRGLNLLTDDDLNRVDLDRLNMDSRNYCVLGQAFGSYENGLDRLDLNYPGEVQHGFLATNSDGYGARTLTAKWKTAIRKRREKGNV